MEKRIRQIRRELARVARALPGRSRRYPEPLRHAAVEVLQTGRVRGLSLEAVARQLGVSAKTLRYWDQGDGGSIRPVVQVPDEQAEGSDTGQSVVLVTPSGYRIEGLTSAQALVMLRALS